MASALYSLAGTVGNALAFSNTNFAFSRLTDHGAEECKGHDLALKKLQRAIDEWNRDRMKCFERNEARSYIKNVDEAMLEYYQVFAKK